MSLLLSLPLLAPAYVPGCTPASSASAVAARACRPVMDETIIQKALSGELEQEGADNVFLSEVGWATYLDQNCESSYAMNERPSMAQDGYFTPDVFSNPIDVVTSWFDSMKRVASDPLETGFMTISNDQSGARSFPKGATEIDTRTIKPKVKDFDAKQRQTGIPGINIFGAPSSKGIF